MSFFRQSIGSAGLLLAAFVVFGFGVAGIDAARAAPQALALVATQGTVDLTCNDSDCGAELTSFCLDSSRFSPSPGTQYSLAGAGEIRLSGITADGRSLALNGRAALRFESVRRHLAVRVSVRRDLLRALGVDRLQVEVADNVALLPEPQPGDAKPISEGEAELLTGPIRQLGNRMVDANGERMQAARVTARMINLLPQGVGDTSGGEAAWRRAMSQDDKQSLSPAARERARGAFELCRYVVTVEGTASFRRCLQAQHDGFVDFLNSKFWRAIKAGT